MVPFLMLNAALMQEFVIAESGAGGRMARLLEVCSGEGLLACAKQLWGGCALAEVGW